MYDFSATTYYYAILNFRKEMAKDVVKVRKNEIRFIFCLRKRDGEKGIEEPQGYFYPPTHTPK